MKHSIIILPSRKIQDQKSIIITLLNQLKNQISILIGMSSNKCKLIIGYLKFSKNSESIQI